MSETLTLEQIHPKFMSVVKQLYVIQQSNIKCKVQIYFGKAEDEISFRYEQIDPEELDKLARIIAKGDNDV